MRLKVDIFDEYKHSESATALAWNTNEEVYSCGDDHALVKWNFLRNEAVKVCSMPDSFFPTTLSFYPKSQSAKKQAADTLLSGTVDGKFHIFNKNGRIDKSVDSHQGAVLIAIWSYDGAGILTAGEDGQAKVWSKSGMLRSTILSGDVPIYTGAWGPDSNQILIAQGNALLHKPLAPNAKTNRWKAHDGLILKIAWSRSNDLIVSAGEDCRYKIWTSQGGALYSSSAHEYPITSVAWSPNGDTFAVAAYNTLRLCDRIGWCHSLHKIATGTIYDLAWSPDGTQLAGACGNGCLVSAHVIDRKLEWKHLEVTLTSREIVTVRSVLDETEEKLEFAERVALMALGFNHLLVTTPSQCYVYSTANWNTPIIVPLKEGACNAISLTHSFYLLVERFGMNIYSYDGKLQHSPKLANFQTENLDLPLISLSPDTLAAVDQVDCKSIHLLELTSGRNSTQLQSIRHGQGIIAVSLSQSGNYNERRVAFLDENRDAYLSLVRNRDSRTVAKLSSMVQAISWCDDNPLLAGIRDSTLTVWCYPASVHIDKHLLAMSTISRDLSDFGKSVSLVNFVGNQVTLRKLDGSTVSHAISPAITVLLDFAVSNNWDDCLRLCRFVNEELLWACLACLSCMEKHLEAAEEAFAAVNELDKVAYVQYIRGLRQQPLRSAHLALLAGNHIEAENILLSNGLIFRAIWLLMERHQWIRALELAIKHRTNVDTVLYRRQRYLESFGRTEQNEKFRQYMTEVEYDIEVVEEKIANELSEN